MPGNESKHQYVTTSLDSLSFGHGNHACPGRLFAEREMKIIMVELLRNWDLRLKGDVEGTGGEEKRPKNILQRLIITADPTGLIEFRRRPTEWRSEVHGRRCVSQ